MRDKIFFLACFGFLFGILLRSLVYINLYVALWFAFIAFFIFTFFLFASLGRSLITGGAKNQWGILASIFIFAFSLGILRFHLSDIPAPEIYELSASLPAQTGQRVSLSGEIIDEPTIKENNQQLIVQIKTGEIKTKILLTADFSDNYKYGDRINFSGKLEKPENFLTDQGKEFDYFNYLRKDGIFYIVRYPQIEIVSRGNGNLIQNFLFNVKEKFLQKINFAIRTPENLLMGGLILGEKSSFSEALRQSFVDTGTIHIVALSGYNVTIVAEWLIKLFSFLSINFAISAGILAIILFVLMTGASSTAIRAGVMAVLALTARATGRNYDVGRALLFAAVLMVLLNPLLLAFDISFQLSFIATVAVIFLAPRIEKYFTWITKRFGLRDVVSVTFAAYIFVLPFILYEMGNLSLVALPANILILPFIPFTMMLGFFTGFAGLVWYGLAIPLGFISYLFLHYELIVISFFSNFPFAAFSFPDFPFWFALLIYIYFVYFLFGKNIKNFFTEHHNISSPHSADKSSIQNE